MVVDTSLLAGRYRLLRRLGSGGAGTVWHATDAVLGRAVAVKLLHEDLRTDTSAVERFRREAVAAAALNHPNAVAIYDIGVENRDQPGTEKQNGPGVEQADPGPVEGPVEEPGREAAGRSFLVMEYVDGAPLSRLLGRPLAVDVTVALGHAIGSALGAAHRLGLVHRDVKPGNVLISRAGQAKVADFGIATAIGDARTQLTAAGTVLGTAAYLAPEQVRGEVVDARADVYALGLILHEALSGQRPFGGGTPIEIATRRLASEVAPLRELRADVPGALAEVVARATRSDPDERYPDGAALAAALDAWLPARPDIEVARLLDQDDSAMTVPLRPADGDGPPTTRVAGAGRNGPPQARPGDTARLEAVTTGATAPAAAPSTPAGSERPATPEPTASERPAAHDADNRPASAAQRPAATIDDLSPTAAAPGKRQGRARGWLGALAALVGAGAVAAAAFLALDGPAGPGDDGGGEVDAGDAGAVTVASASDLDPFGDGGEHGATVPNTLDGDPATVWESERYNSRDFGGLKPGVGLVYDLGEIRDDLDTLDLRFASTGLDLQVIAGEDAPEGTDPGSWGEVIAEVGNAGSQETLDLGGASGRFVTLWVTHLPPSGKAEVAEVTFS